MRPTYRIKDWDAHFETAESRKLNKTRWVPMPTKHDGKSYRRITQHAQSAQIFCAWNLIVQVASKMPTRGVLSDADGPLDAEDLAVKTGFSVEIFALGLEFLSSDIIGWIQTESQQKKPRAARIRQTPPESQREPPINPDSRQSPSPEGKGKEQKGIEGDGREQKIPSPSGDGVATSTEDFTIWNLGVKKIVAADHVSDQSARSFLGEQIKTFGKGAVSHAVTEALAQEAVEPKSYIVAVLQSQNGQRGKQGTSKVDNSVASAGRVAAKYEHQS